MKALLIDDHAMVREGVTAMLRQAFPGGAILQAADIAAAITLAGDHADLDLAVLDLMMPGVSGVAALAAFVEAQPAVPVIVLSSSEDPGDVRAALATGALGYVAKSASPATLLAAVRLVLDGEIYVPTFMAQSPGAAAALPLDQLTERQRDVLRLVAASASNKEIAYRLAISEKTVKAHLTTVFRVLNVASRAEAARLFAQRPPGAAG